MNQEKSTTSSRSTATTEATVTRKEIILPPHLYDRIKASAGEHGGIGRGRLFSEGDPVADGLPAAGVPVCAHGHAWGTCTRFTAANGNSSAYQEPELTMYLGVEANDTAHQSVATEDVRIPFDLWCELLNVKRGVESPRVEAIASVVDCELAFDRSWSIPNRTGL